MKVVWTKRAQDDLEAIHAFIARDSAGYAAQVIETRLSAENAKAAQAKAGSIVRKFLRADIRQVRRYSDRLINRIRPGRIEVLTIVHSKRLFDSEGGDT